MGRALFLLGFVFFGLSTGTASASPLFNVGNRQSPVPADNYLKKVQPILSARCVACHGCYEAPCQLNLESYEGVRRGYHGTPIFSSKRFGPEKPTRPIDAKSIAEWRAKGFHPVLPSKGVEPEGENEDPRDSLFYRLVDQSSRKNAPGFDVNALAPLQKQYDEAQPQCLATQDQFTRAFTGRGKNLWAVKPIEDVLQAHPLAGMPFALPRLDETQDKTLKDWVKDGAIGPTGDAATQLAAPTKPEFVTAWEAFLNGASTKEQQSARYIYEHLFTAHFYIEENPDEFFELVRSRSRDGAIDQIVTELPYHSPGVARAYYRLKKITRAIPQKNHFVVRLNRARLAHWKDLFLNAPEWKDAEVPAPTYDSSNPFKFFAAIPPRVRARFMIENSRNIIAGMTQGSVCVGSTATYAISDHFWVWFLKPESDPSVQSPTLGLADIDKLATAPLAWVPTTRLEVAAVSRIDKLIASDLKTAKKIVAEYHRLFKGEKDYRSDTLEEIALRLKESNLRGADILGALHHYARTTQANSEYQRAYELSLRQMLKAKGRDALSLYDVWRGEGDSSLPTWNPNAWLNVTRHGRSATVQFGEEGGLPQSIWVLSYSNFERLYYNLVASYKEWGMFTHKMATWRHMSYVRLEAEDLAISFLPPEFRKEVRARFTRGLAMVKSVLGFPQWSLAGMNEKRHLNPFSAWDFPARPSPYRNRTADGSIQYLIEATIGLIRPEAAKPVTGPAERLDFERKLAKLMGRSEVKTREKFPQFFPHVSYLKIERANGEVWMYSLNVDRGYKAHNIMLAEDLNRDPQYDDMSFYRGFVGNYPNAFLVVKEEKFDDFLKQAEGLGSNADGKKLLADWGISRNSEKFWPYYDWLHVFKSQASPGVDPVEQGIVDLSQYELF